MNLDPAQQHPQHRREMILLPLRRGRGDRGLLGIEPREELLDLPAPARRERDQDHASVLGRLFRRTNRRRWSVEITPVAVGRLMPTAAAKSLDSIRPRSRGPTTR